MSIVTTVLVVSYYLWRPAVHLALLPARAVPERVQLQGSAADLAGDAPRPASPSPAPTLASPWMVPESAHVSIRPPAGWTLAKPDAAHPPRPDQVVRFVSGDGAAELVVFEGEALRTGDDRTGDVLERVQSLSAQGSVYTVTSITRPGPRSYVALLRWGGARPRQGWALFVSTAHSSVCLLYSCPEDRYESLRGSFEASAQTLELPG